MAVKNKIFLPTLISSVTYQPVRTLPHIYFYNGLKDCEDYYIQHYPSGSTAFVETSVQNKFPYLDYYDGLEPTTGSNSLLFFNETPPYGVTPTGSLYTQYWDKYVSLLYNPRTRLIKASAIIPLADYFEMELNDIVQWRGNYYHLRAINDYNLKDGTCKLELLGPIIRDAAEVQSFDCTFNFSSSFEGFPVPTTTLSPTTSTTLGPTTTTISPTTSTTSGPTTSTTTAVVCVSYIAENVTGEFSPGVSYTDCDGGSANTPALPSLGSTAEFCARQGQYIDPPNVTITEGGTACPTTTTTLSPTTTVSPTTSTTLSPTTSTTTLACPDCHLYYINDDSNPTSYNVTFTDCNGVTGRNISGTQQSAKWFTAITGSVVYSGTRTGFIDYGPVASEYAGGYCKTIDYCKYQTVTLQDVGGADWVFYQYISTASCEPVMDFQTSPQGGQITIISGSLGTYSAAVASFGTVQDGGPCCPTTTTLSPTTTEAKIAFVGSGYGNTVNAACSDASINNRTLYSPCSSINVGCTIYTDLMGTILTGFDFVFIDGAVWEINSSTGVITNFSAIQC